MSQLREGQFRVLRLHALGSARHAERCSTAQHGGTKLPLPNSCWSHVSVSATRPKVPFPMRPASFTDARLSRRYSGPTDPSFRTDTLKRLVPSPSEFSELAYSGFSTLRLHCLATPAEAAARALEVLAARPPRSKELRVVALVLGLDRDSVKAKGASLLEAIDAAFEDSFKEMEDKKREGKLDRGHLSRPTRCRLWAILAAAPARGQGGALRALPGGPKRWLPCCPPSLSPSAALEDGRPIFLVALGKCRPARCSAPAHAGSRMKKSPHARALHCITWACRLIKCAYHGGCSIRSP